MRKRRAQPSSSADPDPSAGDAGRSDSGAGRAKKPLVESSAKETALAMLGRRSYTKRGLRDRLVERFPDDESDAAVARLAQLGLLDDRSYAERFVRDRFGRSGYGPHRIRRDLLRRGVEPVDADAVIESLVGEDEERRKAIEALERFRRRRGSVSTAPPETAYSREARRAETHAAFRHLIGKGYSASLVRDLLDVSL